MIIPLLPPTKQVLCELFPLTTALYETLPDIAADRVVPYFSERLRAVDRGLATYMLRYEIKYKLNSNGIEAEFDSDFESEEVQCGVELGRLSNSGIEGVFESWRFKLLRSRKGAVPPPGRSGRRKQYYSQPFVRQLPLSGFGSRINSRLRPKIVILWDFDKSYKKVEIRIAVPREPQGEFGTVRCHLNVLVPHPVILTSQHPITENAPLAEPEVTWKDDRLADFKVYKGDLQTPTTGT